MILRDGGRFVLNVLPYKEMREDSLMHIETREDSNF